ncbi:MAG: polymorphic outer membrane protein, partial [Gemmatimonadetes bacterium]|nr:polymorphic outer membrane protein [Gemmatimonadota bacterium]
MDHVCCFIPSTRTRCRAAGLAVTALLGLGCKDAPTLTAPPPSGARALQAAATVTVNSTADAVDANPGDGLCATVTGVCTLRAAIQEANALPGDDVISLPPGTYTLTIAGAGEDAAARGDLDITSNVSIQGGGFVGTTIIDGNGGVTGDRVFHVMHGAKADFGGVTIQGGRVHDSGGG